MKQLTILFLLSLLAIALSAPTEKPPTNEEKAKTYLVTYKYLSDQHKDDPEIYRKALLRLQKEGNIEQTGEVDQATLALMDLPRCNFGDAALSDPNNADYRLVPPPWRKKALTYSLRSTTTDMTVAQQQEEFRRAFKVWSDHSGLTFREVSNRGDIEILFATGFHGDGDPFDGPGKTLAHAYFPFAGGDLHLDDSERFTFNRSSGINLFQVAAHEIGHSLGLDHSDDNRALMAAFYRGYIRNFRLSDDDQRGIQRLYGPNTNSPQQPNIPQQPNDPPSRTTRLPFFPQPPNNPQDPPTGGDSFCQNSKLDAIFSISNGRTFGFQGDTYVSFSDNGVERSYPRKIAPYWPGLPDNVDAALDVPQGPSGSEEVWFFKGSRVYYHQTTGRSIRNSQEISRAIPGLPNDIDAIFTWSGNDKVYAMKGSSYYRLNERLNGVDTGYPRSISVWTDNSDFQIRQNLRSGVDTALQYKNGRTYFFKGQQYYRLTDRPLVFDDGYPRPISFWWFGCSN